MKTVGREENSKRVKDKNPGGARTSIASRFVIARVRMTAEDYRVII